MESEMARALHSRARIFELIATLRAAGTPVTVQSITTAMDADPLTTFTQADFLWVKVTLGKRLP